MFHMLGQLLKENGGKGYSLRKWHTFCVLFLTIMQTITDLKSPKGDSKELKNKISLLLELNKITYSWSMLS